MEHEAGHTGHVPKVLILQNHAMIRQILVRVLSEEQGMEVVGSLGTISEAKDQVTEFCPDIVLTDVLLSDGSGIDLVRDLKAMCPNVKVILLTALEDEHLLLSGIAAGADGYVLKSSNYGLLADSIRQVAAGKNVYDPQAVGPILQKLVKSGTTLGAVKARSGGDVLSARERDVADLVSRGLTNKEIASRLSLSIHTVKTHVRRIFKRLGISSRRELLSVLRLPPDILP